MASPGKFIALEGLDGSGQTSQAKLLVDRINQRGPRLAAYTKEPSEGPVGSLIRLALRNRLVKSEKHAALDELTMALCFAADRADHLDSEILPQIAEGVTVVTDRYYLSSMAYQSTKLDAQWLWEINRNFPAPDLTIYLDVPPEECMKRIEVARWKPERYEQLETLQFVRTAFLKSIERLRQRGDSIEVVDGCGSIPAVHEQISAKLQKLA